MYNPTPKSWLQNNVHTQNTTQRSTRSDSDTSDYFDEEEDDFDDEAAPLVVVQEAGRSFGTFTG